MNERSENNPEDDHCSLSQSHCFAFTGQLNQHSSPSRLTSLFFLVRKAVLKVAAVSLKHLAPWNVTAFRREVAPPGAFQEFGELNYQKKAQIPSSGSYRRPNRGGTENGGVSERTQESKLLLGFEDQCVLRKCCEWATDPQKQVSEHREQVSGLSGPGWVSTSADV